MQINKKHVSKKSSKYNKVALKTEDGFTPRRETERIVSS